MKRSVQIMLAFRLAYLILIAIAAIHEQWDSVTMHIPIFLGTLLIPYFGRNEPKLYLFDVFVVAIFSLSMTIVYLPTLTATYGKVFGIDKIFHVFGGFGAAWGIALIYRQETGIKLVILVVIGALAIGAAWEIFEWVLSLLPPPLHVWHSGLADAMMDLIADTIGGILLGLLAWRTKLLNLEN